MIKIKMVNNLFLKRCLHDGQTSDRWKERRERGFGADCVIIEIFEKR